MSCSNMEERKKRMVVPIVAIMMCAVAFIGLGYAYTSSVTSSNTVSEGDFYVDIAKDYSTFTDVNYNYETNKVNNIFNLSVMKGKDKTQTGDNIEITDASGNELAASNVYLRTMAKNANDDLNVSYALTSSCTQNGTPISGLTFKFYATDAQGNATGSALTTFQAGQIYLVETIIADGTTLSSGNTVSITFTATSA